MPQLECICQMNTESVASLIIIDSTLLLSMSVLAKEVMTWCKKCNRLKTKITVNVKTPLNDPTDKPKTALFCKK